MKKQDISVEELVNMVRRQELHHRVENFPRFLEARREMLARAIDEYIDQCPNRQT